MSVDKTEEYLGATLSLEGTACKKTGGLRVRPSEGSKYLPNNQAHRRPGICFDKFSPLKLFTASMRRPHRTTEDCILTNKRRLVRY